MKIENVNKGVCQWRATNNQPPYFVNYHENGKNQYQYFRSVSEMYNLYDKLKQLEKI